MRGPDGEDIFALIPTDTDLRAVGKALRALVRSHKGAMVRDVEHSGTYLPKHGLPRGVMEVFIPAKKEKANDDG
jgi:hypothetical protein